MTVALESRDAAGQDQVDTVVSMQVRENSADLVAHDHVQRLGSCLDHGYVCSMLTRPGGGLESYPAGSHDDQSRSRPEPFQKR
jgi:hypothetical protein